jgi:nucleoside-diphosphate-sugar epimerase
MTDKYRIKIGRISTTYGPGFKPDDSRVINDLIKKSINSNKISLMDDGSATRTLCYIGDMCEMIFNVICNGSSTIYNLTGKEKVSIKNIAEVISSHTGSPIGIMIKIIH